MSESKEVQSLIERVVGEISERRVAELRKDVVKRITRETEDIVDAVFYVVDNGIKWRALPADYPPWRTV